MNTDKLLLKLKTLSNETKVFLVFISLSALVLTTYGIYALTNIFGDDPAEQISQEEKDDIFEKIIANNPQSILEEKAKEVKKAEVINSILSDPFSNTGSENPSSPSTQSAETIYSRLEEVSKQLDEITNQPPMGNSGNVTEVNTNYNYSYSKETYTQGPKVCNLLEYNEIGEGGGYIYRNKDTVTEYYDYSEIYNKYYYKIKKTNTNLNLLAYSLYKNDRSQNNSIAFAEGDYAIRSHYPINNFPPVSYPASYPSSYSVLGASSQSMSLQEKMEYYFGKGIKIDKIYEENGKKYVQLSRSYSSICNWDPESTEFYQPKSTFVEVLTVNQSNYNIEDSKTYLDEIKPENLIRETTFVRETKKATLAEVENVFTYEYSKPIKDTYYTNNTSYEQQRELRNEAVLNYIQQNNLNLLVPSREHYNLSYVFTDSPICYTEWCDLYYNRAFYPMNDLGQSLYDENINFLKSNPVFAKPIVTLYFKNKHHGYSHDIQINLYANSQSEAKIRNSQLYYSQFEKGLTISNGSVNLLINNQLNGGNYLEMESRYDYVSYPASYPISYPASYPNGYVCHMNSCFYKGGKIILSYRDSNYLVSYSGDRKEYLSDISYTTLKPAEPADADVFRMILQTAY